MPPSKKILSTSDSVMTIQDYCRHISSFLPTPALSMNSSLGKKIKCTRFRLFPGGESPKSGKFLETFSICNDDFREPIPDL